MVTIQQLFIGDENAKLRYLGIDLVSGSNISKYFKPAL